MTTYQTVSYPVVPVKKTAFEVRQHQQKLAGKMRYLTRLGIEDVTVLTKENMSLLVKHTVQEETLKFSETQQNVPDYWEIHAELYESYKRKLDKQYHHTKMNFFVFGAAFASVLAVFVHVIKLI